MYFIFPQRLLYSLQEVLKVVVKSEMPSKVKLKHKQNATTKLTFNMHCFNGEKYISVQF